MADEKINKPVVRPENTYCPRCGAVIEKKDKFCPECGATLLPEDKNKKDALSTDVKKSDSDEAKKKKRKKQLIIAGVILGFIALIAGAWAYVSYSREAKAKKEYEDKINPIWSEIVDRSTPVKDEIGKVAKVEDLTVLSDKIEDLQRTLRNKNSDLDPIDAPASYKDSKSNLKDFITKYLSYVSNLKDNILDKNLEKVNDSAYDDVSKLASDAKNALDKFMSSSSFIKKSIPSEVFDMVKIKSKIKGLTEASEEAKAKAAAEAAAKAEAEAKAAVEKVASDFMTALPGAYSGGDSWASAQAIAGNYWTAGGMGNDSTPGSFRSEYHAYFASEVAYKGGRVLTSEKLSDTKHKVSVEEREETMGGGNTFLGYFIVEKSGSKWFITSHGKS